MNKDLIDSAKRILEWYDNDEVNNPHSTQEWQEAYNNLRNALNSSVNEYIRISEVEKFIWDTAEDYHLWDEEENGVYPVKRMINAMSKWWTMVKNKK